MTRTLTLAVALSLMALMPTKAEENTAEKHFAAHFYNSPAGMHLSVFFRPSTGLDIRKLSPTERKKYDDRIKRAELAALVLYGQKCRIHWEVNQNGFWIGAMDKTNYEHVTALFDALPEEQKTEAIEHERKHIEARPDITHHYYETIKGGWSWFCSVMHDHIIDGIYKDYIVSMPKLKALVGRGAHQGGGGYGPGSWRMWLHVVNRGREFYRLTKWSCSFSYKGEKIYEDTFYVEQIAARSNTDKMVMLFTGRGIDDGQCRLLDAIKGNPA
jgi:hypothetical protein